MRYGSLIMRLGGVAAATLLSLAVVISTADARSGRGGSVGSRGDRTFSAPPSTNTAPGTAKPMERTMTDPGKASSASAGAQTAAGAATKAAPSNMFRNILLGGLIGAGLASIFGVGALANVLGFLLQAALIAGIVFLIVSFIRSRRSPAPAMATAGAASSPPQNTSYRQAQSGIGGSAEPALAIGPDDFDAFERLLGEIQMSYGVGDIKALEHKLTPEMLSYFAEELSDNAKKGLRNEIGAVKLLQGDLSESWREARGDYATVAMRYALTDVTVETATGRIVSGDRTTPEEATEIWTFWRPRNGTPAQWELSAIQQVN